MIGLGSFNPEGNSPGKKCYFQTSDGTHKEDDVNTKQLIVSFNKINYIDFVPLFQEQYCEDSFDGTPSHFTCRKASACSKCHK